MQGPLSTGLDYLGAVLDLRGQRQQILAADIANAGTPGFKAVDLDFKAALAAANKGADAPFGNAAATGSGVDAQPSPLVLRVDDVRQFGGSPSSAAGAVANAIKYQTGNSVTLDGNSVDLDFEKREAAVNALQYEAVATMTTSRVNLLATAIRGAGAGKG
jgi:flagellar basal-body rod protein FlgB